jgi:3-oxoadipate enol-lactonase
VAASHLHWGERLLALLAECFEVVAYDHRGIGRSAPVQERFTIADLADDAAGLLDELGWTHANVLGVSLGGVVAQELALRHSDRVHRLILGCTDAGGAIPLPSRAGASRAVVHGDPETTIRNLFRFGVKDPDTLDQRAWLEYRDAALSAPMRPRTTALQIDALSAHTTADRLHRIDAPTLVVHGDTDRITDLQAAAAVAAGLPAADLAVLQAGHFFWLEQPERTAELIRDFCTRPGRRPDARQTNSR